MNRFVPTIFSLFVVATVFSRENDESCCVAPKRNIDVGLANIGRQFFSELISNNDSFRKINETTICSLIHFFMQESSINDKRIDFSKGMFVLYDSSKQFFSRFMAAKDVQPSGDEQHRSGYYKRLKHFAHKAFQTFFPSSKINESEQDALIYLRADESSHFRERGSTFFRQNVFPAYGVDISSGCLPNGFGHILFGKLKSLFDDENDPFYGERIYIKPEEYGLQKWKDYIGHSGKFLVHVSRRILCRVERLEKTPICSSDEAFRENIDRKVTNKWKKILATVANLTSVERKDLVVRASNEGIREIFEQTKVFANEIDEVRRFQDELENKFGRDVRARKGNEIIFSSRSLLESRRSCRENELERENFVCAKSIERSFD